MGSANRGWDHGNPVYAPVILATVNGGATWSAEDATSAGTRGHLNSIAFVDAAHGCAVGGSATTSAAGKAVILATTNGGFLPRPSLTSLRPAVAKHGAVVTITGTNFGAKRGTNFVKFDATKRSKYLSWSTTRISCLVPVTAKLGSLAVTVSTIAGTSGAKTLRVKR